MSMLWAITAMSWDITTGYMGRFHFAQATFLGIGAYASTLISMHLYVSPWLSMPLGGIVAGVFSLGLSLSTLRLKGWYMALVSLAFAELVRRIIVSWVSVFGGLSGIWGIPSLFKVAEMSHYYYTVVGLYAISITIFQCIVKSRYGLAIVAIRESSPSARSLGIEIIKIEIVIFFVSAALTGIAGAFYAHYVQSISPPLLELGTMIDVMAMAMLGGGGSLYGPTIGAFMITLVLEYFRIVGIYRFIIYGVSLIIIMLFRPKGIYGGIANLVGQIRSKVGNMKIESK